MGAHVRTAAVKYLQSDIVSARRRINDRRRRIVGGCGAAAGKAPFVTVDLADREIFEINRQGSAAGGDVGGESGYRRGYRLAGAGDAHIVDVQIIPVGGLILDADADVVFAVKLSQVNADAIGAEVGAEAPVIDGKGRKGAAHFRSGAEVAVAVFLAGEDGKREGVPPVNGDLYPQDIAGETGVLAIGVVDLQEEVGFAGEVERRRDQPVQLPLGLVVEVIDKSRFFTILGAADAGNRPGNIAVRIVGSPGAKAVLEGFIEQHFRPVVVDGDIRTEDGEVRSDIIRNVQGYRPGSGCGVGHHGMLLAGAGRRSAGKGPVPTGRVIPGIIDERHDAARADVGNRRLNSGDRRCRWRAGTEAGAAVGDQVDITVDLVLRVDRPGVRVVYRRRHDGRRAGGVVSGVEVMAQFVGLQHAQQAGVAGKMFEHIVAQITAQSAQPGHADGASLEVAVCPQRSNVKRGSEPAAVAPVAKAVQQIAGVRGGRPGVAARAGGNELGDDGKLYFVGKFVVVVGLHVIQHAEGEVFRSVDAAEEVEHGMIGSQRDFDLVAFAVFLQVLRKLAFARPGLRKSAAGVGPGPHVGRFVYQHVIRGGAGNEELYRLDEVVVVTGAQVAVEEMLVDGESQRGAAARAKVAGIGFVRARRPYFDAVRRCDGQPVAGRPQIVGNNTHGPVVHLTQHQPDVQPVVTVAGRPVKGR